jgi:hypothetical protein
MDLQEVKEMAEKGTLIKHPTIRGESILSALAPELVRILNDIPRTGSAEIKIMMKNHRITGTAYKYSHQEQGTGGTPDPADADAWDFPADTPPPRLLRFGGEQ